jgi:hypothetical protein
MITASTDGVLALRLRGATTIQNVATGTSFSDGGKGNPEAKGVVKNYGRCGHRLRARSEFKIVSAEMDGYSSGSGR